MELHVGRVVSSCVSRQCWDTSSSGSQTITNRKNSETNSFQMPGLGQFQDWETQDPSEQYKHQAARHEEADQPVEAAPGGLDINTGSLAPTSAGKPSFFTM